MANKKGKTLSTVDDYLEYFETLDFWETEVTKLNIWLEFGDFYEYINEAIAILKKQKELSHLSPAYLVYLYLLSFDRERFSQKVSQEMSFLVGITSLQPKLEKTTKNLKSVLADVDLLLHISDQETKKQLSILALFALCYHNNPFVLVYPIWAIKGEDGYSVFPKTKKDLFESTLFKLIQEGFQNDLQINLYSSSIFPQLAYPSFVGSMLRVAISRTATDNRSQNLFQSDLKIPNPTHEYAKLYGRLITDLLLRYRSCSPIKFEIADEQADRSDYIACLQNIPDVNYRIYLGVSINETLHKTDKKLDIALIQFFSLGDYIQKRLLLSLDNNDTSTTNKRSFIDEDSHIFLDFLKLRKQLSGGALASSSVCLAKYNYERLLNLFFCLYENISDRQQNASVESAIKELDKRLPGFKKRHNTSSGNRGKRAMLASAEMCELQPISGKKTRKNFLQFEFTDSCLAEKMAELTKDIPEKILEHLHVDLDW